MVVNGACKYKDMDHFKRYLPEMKGHDISMEYLGEHQLLALQVKYMLLICDLNFIVGRGVSLHILLNNNNYY
jgi:hypothetical protein